MYPLSLPDGPILARSVVLKGMSMDLPTKGAQEGHIMGVLLQLSRGARPRWIGAEVAIIIMRKINQKYR